MMPGEWVEVLWPDGYTRMLQVVEARPEGLLLRDAEMRLKGFAVLLDRRPEGGWEWRPTASADPQPVEVRPVLRWEPTS